MRIAVIGAGNMGQRRIRILRALGERDIIVLDDNPSRAADVAIQYGIRTSDWRDLWGGDSKVLFVCTPPQSHWGIIGSDWNPIFPDFFCEKPLAITWEDLRHFEIETVTDYDDGLTQTMVGCNLRFHPGPQAVTRWLAEGAIGPLREAHVYAGYNLSKTRPDWRTCYAATTGAILDVGSHMVDLALDWFGPATLIEAKARPATPIGLPDIDGHAMLRLRHQSGVDTTVTAAFDSPGRAQGAVIIGELGSIDYSYEGRWAARRLGGEENGDRITWSKEAEEEMYVREVDTFLGCVRDGRPTPNPISRASQTLRILLEARGTWQPSLAS